MKMKLTPVYLMLVLSVAAAFPVLMEMSVLSVGAAVSFIAIAALLVERDGVTRGSMFAQRGEVGERLKAVESEYKEVTKNLKDIGDQLKAHAENAQKELKKNSELSAQTKQNVDTLLVAQGELQARLQAAEQKMVSLEDRGDGPHKVVSLGQHVADSEAFKNFDPRMSQKFSVSINAAITSLDSSAGSLIEPQRVAGVIATPNRRLTIRDLISPGRTESNSIEYVRETGFTNSADVVSENPTNVKPESSIQFELDTETVATIAHWIRASRQVLSDAKMLSSYIDSRLRYGLQLKEEAQLLKGSGVGLNINGIYTQATAYSNPGVVVQAQTRIDQLRLALLQAELAEYYADGIVLSPVDWAAIELTKTSENAYLLANPHGTATASLWSRPVVPTQAMDAGDFLVGAFQMAAQVWDREDANVVVSTEDRDNLVKNMVTILAEERLALTVYRPEAFVKGEFEGESS